MFKYKRRLGENYKLYSHDLINNLFNHPYTKIEFVERELIISRKTASGYLNQLAKDGILKKVKIKKSNYYVNVPVFDIFITSHG